MLFIKMNAYEVKKVLNELRDLIKMHPEFDGYKDKSLAYCRSLENGDVYYFAEYLRFSKENEKLHISERFCYFEYTEKVFFNIYFEPENKYFKSNEIALFLDQVVEAKKIIEEERTNLKELMKFLNENPNIQYRFSKQDVVLTCGKKEIRVSIYSYFLIENTGQIKEYFEYIILDSEYIYEVTLPELKELIIKNCYCSK